MNDDHGSGGDIRSRIDAVGSWRHRIDLGHGVVTPGREDSAVEVPRLGIPSDLSGQRVIDIGCSDGFFSFEAERRGGEVVAVDDESSLMSSTNGFRLCAEILGSNASYVSASVETISPQDFGTFDLALFINVLYHVQNPMLALGQLKAVMNPGGLLVLKTHFRTDVRIWVRGRPLGFDVDRRPKWWYFPSTELGGDPTNWWSPNRSGLLGMLTATGWGDLKVIGTWGDRIYVHARA